jgi:inorganic phosphate transporter, PiT family
VTVLVLAIAMALAFAVTNGFHDAANAIAALVATRVARPGPAVVLASVGNILGPIILGAAVADTIAGIVTVPSSETVAVIGAGLTAAVVWNTFTWRLGLPSSSSHALVGGLVGAAVFAAGIDAVNWGGLDGWRPVGVLGILIALVISPILGFAAAAVASVLSARALRRASTAVHRPVRRGEWLAAGALAFTHGSNDAAKTMGVIAALLVADDRIASVADLPLWVKVASGMALTFGTATGGWRIVATIGQRIYRLRPLDGLVSTSSSAAVILASSLVGAPVSTSQVVSSSVVGTGAGRGHRHHVHWAIVREIVLAWCTTLPLSALLGAAFVPLWRWFP